jgi:hypothetical protein
MITPNTSSFVSRRAGFRASSRDETVERLIPQILIGSFGFHLEAPFSNCMSDRFFLTVVRGAVEIVQSVVENNMRQLVYDDRNDDWPVLLFQQGRKIDDSDP